MRSSGVEPSGLGPLSLLRSLGLLCVLCATLYLPGIAGIPPLDRDEARFAQATRQMLETGDFLRIRFQDEARNKKPAGIYWLQAASVSLFSTPDATAIWPYRLPSALAATVAVLMMFLFGVAFYGGGADPGMAWRAGLYAGGLLGCALGVAAEAHLGKTDATLLAAIVAAQGMLGLAYVRSRRGEHLPWGYALGFWLAEAIGILLKGPIAPGLAALTVATLALTDHDLRWLKTLRPLVGVLVVLIIVLPWIVAIQGATEGRFLSDSLGRDFFSKLIGGEESHGAPPFYYLLLSIVTFWPGSLFVVRALLRGWRLHERPVERFLLAWLVPAWVLLELVPTKLPHYVLPLYPAVALLVGRMLAEDFEIGPDRVFRWVEIGVTVLWAAVTLALAAALIVLPMRFADGPLAAGIGGAVVMVAVGAMLLLRRRQSGPAVALTMCLSLAFVVPAGIVVLPGLDRLWVSREAAAMVAQHRPRPGHPIVSVGYSEPSLVFLLGTDTKLETVPGAAEALHDGGEALVSGREDAMFHQALAARGLAALPLARAPGLDYSNGQRLVLTLYDVEPR